MTGNPVEQVRASLDTVYRAESGPFDCVPTKMPPRWGFCPEHVRMQRRRCLQFLKSHVGVSRSRIAKPSQGLDRQVREYVGRRDFEKEVGAALEATFKLLARPAVRLSH